MPESSISYLWSRQENSPRERVVLAMLVPLRVTIDVVVQLPHREAQVKPFLTIILVSGLSECHCSVRP